MSFVSTTSPFGGTQSPGYKPLYLHTLAVTDYVQFAMAISDRSAKLVFIHDYMAGLVNVIDRWSAADGSIGTFEYGPQGVHFDGDNILIICDSDDSNDAAIIGNIHIFDAALSFSDSWVPQKRPTRCTADGDYIYVISQVDGFVSKYSYAGVHIVSRNDYYPGGTPYIGPMGIAELGDYLYIADTGNNKIVKIQKSDLVTVGDFDVFNFDGSALVNPIDVAVDDSGNIYVLTEEEVIPSRYERTIQIYNAAFALQRTIFGESAYTGLMRSIALTPLADIYYLDGGLWEVGSLILPFKGMGTWTYTFDAGEQTEFTSASWAYEIATPGQEVLGRVAVSGDGVSYGAWSIYTISGMPIPPGHREGRYLKLRLELRQPSGLTAPFGWPESPRVTEVLILWEEAVWTGLEGKVSIYLQDPKLMGGVQPVLEMPFARARRFEGEPQFATRAPGFGYTKPVQRPQHVNELFSVTSDFYEKAQSFSAVTDFRQQYYIVFTHENENTGLVQTFTFWLCDFQGHAFSDSEDGGPTQITLTYRPKLVT